jgi:hypothetical protein
MGLTHYLPAVSLSVERLTLDGEGANNNHHALHISICVTQADKSSQGCYR